MGKIKVKRKSTLIDMTAMSDVTVLLLTFFMLTSTFLQKEPTQVVTPPSVSEDLVPESNLVQVLVATDEAGENVKTYITLYGEADENYPEKDEVQGLEPGMWSSENMRRNMLANAVSEFKQRTQKDPGITAADVEEFAKIGAFGVPMMELHHFLSSTPAERDEWITNLEDPRSGIPLATYIPGDEGQKISEFQIWMKAIRDAGNPTLTERMRKTGEGIAVKADQYTPFNKVNEVLESLRTIKLNKFTVMTALKSADQD